MVIHQAIGIDLNLPEPGHVGEQVERKVCRPLSSMMTLRRDWPRFMTEGFLASLELTVQNVPSVCHLEPFGFAQDKLRGRSSR
jgi:hypothetical protein